MTDRGVLVEREDVFATISRLLEAALNNNGGAVFVVGDAGLGKTSILESVVALADKRFDVALATASPNEAAIPFGTAHAALQRFERGDMLSRRPVDKGLTVGPNDARAAYFYRSILRLKRARRPQVVAVDDLQWADADSLRLFAFLCRRLNDLKVVFVASLRSWPSQAFEVASELSATGYAATQYLQPLSFDGVVRLLDSLLGNSRPQNKAEMLRAFKVTAGNPLLVSELANAMRMSADLAAQTTRPVHLRGDLLMLRFVGMDQPTLRYAEVASIFGVRFWPQLIPSVAGLSDVEGEQALEALIANGVVRSCDDSAAEFSHPLFQQTLYEGMSRPLRASRHAAAMRVLADRGFDANEVAMHALHSNLRGDRQAIGILESAGAQGLAAGALAAARDCFEAAVAVAGELAPAGLLRRLGETLVASGSMTAAGAVLRHALKQPDLQLTDEIATRNLLAYSLALQGGIADAKPEFARAARLALEHDSEAAVQILLTQALVYWMLESPRAGAAFARQAMDVARSLDRADLHLRASAAYLYCTIPSGDPSQLDFVQRVLAAEDPAPEQDVIDVSSSWSAAAAGLLLCNVTEQFAEGERLFGIAYRTAERVQVPASTAWLALARANTLTRYGRLDEALEFIGRAQDLADLAPLAALWCPTGRAEIMLLKGRIDETERAYADIQAQIVQNRTVNPVLHLYELNIRAGLLLHAGRAEEACQVFECMEDFARKTEIIEPCAVPWARRALTAYLRCDRMNDVDRVLQLLDAASEQLPCRWPRIVATTTRAVLAERCGNTTDALEAFERALELHAELPMRLAEVETLIMFGGFLRRNSRPAQARPLLRQAAEIAATCGARPLLEQAERELAASGGRRAGRRHAPTALTAREHQVIERARQGLTDREISVQLGLSIRTVETHLFHAYEKLGIRSRRQLILAEIQRRDSRTSNVGRLPLPSQNN